MNIWCISKYASIPPYGTGARLFHLTKAFIDLGHNAILVTSDSNHLAQYPSTDKVYNYAEPEGVPVYWLKTIKYRKSFSVARVVSWLDFERRLFGFKANQLAKPDVVIISSLSIFSIVYGLYLKRKFKAFLVFEIRDIWPLTMTEEAGFSDFHPLVLFIGFLEKIGYKHSDLIVGTMPKLDVHVNNVLGYSRPFHCSPLGFKEENYVDQMLDAERNPFNDVFPKNKVVIGYSGSMGISNALDPFINLIYMLRDNQDIHFMLVGSGDLKKQYEKQLSQCSNVNFLPKIGQDEVKYFLAKCDIVFLSTKPSKVWEYGQSMNKVVEYMLAGKPIIATYTGFPSMINEADCGVFIKSTASHEVEKDIKVALFEMVNLSKEEREKIGKRGQDWIKSRRSYSLLAKEYLGKISEEINKSEVKYK